MERHNGTAYCSLFVSASGDATFSGLPPAGVPTTFAPGPLSSAVSSHCQPMNIKFQGGCAEET
ncbi:hypothetical protein LY78DRAFT_364253 [Colletotrichum sublineola]|nr:hypothetical protein LY78DRAFT_364253 [Colletotrichum sublineola]